MTGKGRQLVDMMLRRKMDILCVQETRWKVKDDEEGRAGDEVVEAKKCNFQKGTERLWVVRRLVGGCVGKKVDKETWG